jgi:ABC-type transport system substrate-binding protein
VNGGPFPIGLNFYAADYISPDDATQLDALSYGSYNACLSNFVNYTVVDPAVYAAAATTDPAAAAYNYSQITQVMYSQYADVWLLVPTFYAVYSPLLHGLYLNPMGSAQPVTMEYNTYYVK